MVSETLLNLATNISITQGYIVPSHVRCAMLVLSWGYWEAMCFQPFTPALISFWVGKARCRLCWLVLQSRFVSGHKTLCVCQRVAQLQSCFVRGHKTLHCQRSLYSCFTLCAMPVQLRSCFSSISSDLEISSLPFSVFCLAFAKKSKLV